MANSDELANFIAIQRNPRIRNNNIINSFELSDVENDEMVDDTVDWRLVVEGGRGRRI